MTISTLRRISLSRHGLPAASETAGIYNISELPMYVPKYSVMHLGRVALKKFAGKTFVYIA